MLFSMLYSRPIPPFCARLSTWQVALGMPVLKPWLCLYHPLLVILQKHLRKGTRTGRTVTTSGSLLLRIPWSLYWQGIGGFAALPTHTG